MRGSAFALLLMIVGVVPSLAQADPVDEAYLAGDFLKAAALAEEEGGADNLARAARCLLADEIASGKLDEAALKRAELLARAALDEHPDHVEARLQLAIALSMRARLMSTREVLDTGVGKRGHDLASSVLEDEPENAYAHGFLSVWNLEVMNRGGTLGAAWFGAGMDSARHHFQKALQADPDNPALCWQYGRALAAHDYRRYRQEVFEALTCALEGEASDEIDRLMQARARAFWTFARNHSRREIEARADALL